MSRQAQYTSVSTVEQDGQFETASPRTSTKPFEGGSYPDPSHPKPKSTRKSISPILQPVCILLLGSLLAVGHHIFNTHADGKLVGSVHSVPQVWMNRIGNGFAVAFKSALSTSLSFVICQLMWLTFRTKFMRFSEIDQVYRVAGKEVAATFFSSAIFKSPLLVTAAALSFLLPIPTIFTPSSLQVAPHTVSNWSPCQVPTGNLTNGGEGSTMYLTGGWGYWAGVTPVARKLALSTFVGQKIPSLPQPCGSNCTYSVTVPSFAFRCQEGVELPASMQLNSSVEPFWNTTATEPKGLSIAPATSFYVYWKSSQASGTNGTALCDIGSAQYNFTVQTTNGQQVIAYNVTQTGDLPNTRQPATGFSTEEWELALQLSSVAATAQSLLMGTISIHHGASSSTPEYDSSITSAAFFDPSLNSGSAFTWGDVPRGIEQLSHNISAAILTMDLGVQNSSCFVTTQDIVYQYDRLSLWLPYGAALLVVSLCMAVSIAVFHRLNPQNLTSSFSDTVGITRNPSLDIFAKGKDDMAGSKRHSPSLRFRFGELKDGRTGFGMPEDFKSE